MSIYLLVGARQSVRLDMTPAADGNRGVLELMGRPFSRSEGVVTYVDLPIRGCPADFDADSSPFGRSQPLVVHFVQALVNTHRNFFTFTYIGGDSMGCHHWV